MSSFPAPMYRLTIGSVLEYVKLGLTLPEVIGVITWYVALCSQGWDG